MPPMKETTKALREKTPKVKIKTQVAKGIKRAKSTVSRNKKKMMKAMSSVIAVFLLLVAMAALYSNYSTTRLIAIVQDQMTALRTGNIVTAYSYTSSDFKDSISLEGFKKFVNQYSPLKYNLSMTFVGSNNSGGEGDVNGRLVSKDGRTADVTFHLVKENNDWKISFIHLTRTAGVHYSDNIDLSKLFESKNNYYTIQFPKNWIILNAPNRKVTFTGTKGTPSYSSTISIQGFGSKLARGQYSDIQEIITDMKKQLAGAAMNVKLLEQGSVRLPLKPQEYFGEYLIFTYFDQGYMFKKMQFILERSDQKAFYIFDYTSPIQQFNADLPIARAMYESWDIE